MQMVREDVSAAGRGGRYRPQYDGSCSIAEQDTGAAVLPVQNSRKCLGSDNECGPRLAEADRVVGHRKGKDEACTDGLHIKGRTLRPPELGLHFSRSSGE